MSNRDNFRIIVPATEEELEKYYKLRYEVLRKKWGQEENTTRDEWEEQSLHVMMVDDDRNAVATGRLQFNQSGEGQIRSMAVADDYQRMGLGTRILHYLENEARTRKLKTLVLDARNNAVDFYLKNGYKVEGDSYVLFGVIPHFRMAKELSGT